MLVGWAVALALASPVAAQSVVPPIPGRYVLLLDAARAPDSAAVAASLTRWSVPHKALSPTIWVLVLYDPAVLPTAAFDSVWAVPGRTTLDLDELIAPSTIHHSGAAAPPWGINYVRAPQTWAAGNTGQGVVVGIIDSGIMPHPLLDIAGGRNFNGGDVKDWTDNVPQCNGHGTHVAGTVAAKTDYGVAPGARVYALKVFSAMGSVTDPAALKCLAWSSHQMAAIQWAQANGIRVLNASIGGSAAGSYMLAIESYAKAGGIFVGSSGNSGGNTVSCPGCYDYGTAVGSLTSSGSRSSFSQYGVGLDFMAPGSGITSTMPSGGTGSKSGTSMASPHVAGVAALVLARRPELGVYDFHELLRLTAKSKPSEGRSAQQGFGHVDAFAADSFLVANPGWRAPPVRFTQAEVVVAYDSRPSVDTVYVTAVVDPWGWKWAAPEANIFVSKLLGKSALQLTYYWTGMTGPFPKVSTILTTVP
jgi:subtilisin family serine protease